MANLVDDVTNGRAYRFHVERRILQTLLNFGSGEIVVSQRSPVYSGRTLLFGERVNLVSWNDCGGPLVSLLGRFGVLSIRQGRERALSRNTLGQTHLDDDD